MYDKSQLMRGTLEGAILKILSANETYGYEILVQLQACGFGEIKEGTIYPLLIRLEKKGIILRESVASDARLKSLVPTERAVELNARVYACLQEADRMLTRGLSEGQVQLFKETAVKMAQNLDEWDGEETGPDPAPGRETALAGQE